MPRPKPRRTMLALELRRSPKAGWDILCQDQKVHNVPSREAAVAWIEARGRETERGLPNHF